MLFAVLFLELPEISRLATPLEEIWKLFVMLFWLILRLLILVPVGVVLLLGLELFRDLLELWIVLLLIKFEFEVELPVLFIFFMVVDWLLLV